MLRGKKTEKLRNFLAGNDQWAGAGGNIPSIAICANGVFGFSCHYPWESSRRKPELAARFGCDAAKGIRRSVDAESRCRMPERGGGTIAASLFQRVACETCKTTSSVGSRNSIAYGLKRLRENSTSSRETALWATEMHYFVSGHFSRAVSN